VFLRTVNALCVCLHNKHPRSIKESSGQTSQSFQSTPHKCDFGAEPRSRIIVTSAVKGLNNFLRDYFSFCEIRTPLGRAKSALNFEVSSFQDAIGTENSSFRPDKESLFHKVAIRRFHCIVSTA
jgi:hypothetical protein